MRKSYTPSMMKGRSILESPLGRTMVLALAVLLCGSLTGCKTTMKQHAAGPKKVLVVTVTKGFRHSSIPTAEKVLGELAQKSGAFTVDYVRNDEEMEQKMTAEALQNY